MVPARVTYRGGLLAGLCLMAAGCRVAGPVDVPPAGSTVATGRCPTVAATRWAQAALPSSQRIGGWRVGGLSGINYRPRTNDYLLVTDDRGAHGGARLLRVALDFRADHSIAVRPLGVTALTQADGRSFSREGMPGAGVDAEAVRAGTGDTVLWTSEGSGARAQGPALFRTRPRPAPG